MTTSERRAGSFVDANVVVRYLSSDDEELMARARSAIEVEEPRIIPVVALLEAALVLRRVYGYRSHDIATAIVDLVARANIAIAEHPKATALAMLQRWRAGGIGSLGDAMIAASMTTHGATRIYSFDRRFAHDLGWQVTLP
jgi:predicted nucleic-acid-binding protein